MDERDSRLRMRQRRLIFLIEDYAAQLPLTNDDQEWIAEQVEDVLRTKFDIKIQSINIEEAHD